MGKWLVEIDHNASTGKRYRSATMNSKAAAVNFAAGLVQIYDDEIYLISFYNPDGLRVGVWRMGSEAINWDMETDRRGWPCVKGESFSHTNTDFLKSYWNYSPCCI